MSDLEPNKSVAGNERIGNRLFLTNLTGYDEVVKHIIPRAPRETPHGFDIPRTQLHIYGELRHNFTPEGQAAVWGEGHPFVTDSFLFCSLPGTKPIRFNLDGIAIVPQTVSVFASQEWDYDCRAGGGEALTHWITKVLHLRALIKHIASLRVSNVGSFKPVPDYHAIHPYAKLPLDMPTTPEGAKYPDRMAEYVRLVSFLRLTINALADPDLSDPRTTGIRFFDHPMHYHLWR